MYDQESDIPIDFIFQNLPASIWWEDRNHIYLGCNLENCRICKVNAPEDVIGKNIFDIVKIVNRTSAHAQEIYDIDEHVMQTGIIKTDFHGILPQIEREKDSVYEACVLSSIFDQNKLVIGLIGIGITNVEISNQPKIIAP